MIEPVSLVYHTLPLEIYYLKPTRTRVKLRDCRSQQSRQISTLQHHNHWPGSWLHAHDQVQLGKVLSWLHHPNSEDRSPSHPASRHIWVTLGWYLDGVWLIWLCAILTPYFPDIENSITHLYENLLKSFRITCCCCCCFGSSEKKGAVHYRWRFLQHIIFKRRMEYQKHQYIFTHWNETIYI